MLKLRKDWIRVMLNSECTTAISLTLVFETLTLLKYLRRVNLRWLLVVTPWGSTDLSSSMTTFLVIVIHCSHALKVCTWSTLPWNTHHTWSLKGTTLLGIPKDYLMFSILSVMFNHNRQYFIARLATCKCMSYDDTVAGNRHWLWSTTPTPPQTQASKLRRQPG